MKTKNGIIGFGWKVSFAGFLVAALAGVSSVQATVLTTNDFSYTGALTANGWTAYSGGDASITADGSVANIGSGAEDISLPFTDQTVNPVYASFVINVASLPASGADYSFGFIDGSTMESRFGISVTGGGTTYRLAAFGAGSSALSTISSDLALNTNYTVVIYFDGVSDHRLWVDPTAGGFGTPNAQATAANNGMDGFFIRQAGALDNGAAGWSIDNLQVATTFEDLVTGTPVVSTNVSFTVAADSVAENVGTYEVTVTKSLAEGNVSGEITLAGTATEGVSSDYTIDTTNFVMNGATTSATFTITVNDDTDPESAETIELAFANVVGGTVATPSTFTLTIDLNDIPPASIIISQYTDTDSGTVPKGIELWNVSGSDITFDDTTNKLDVLKGVNGAALALDVSVTNGTITAGDVIVIGTADMSPDYVYAFSFNGDDALQIQLGGIVQDTFGDPGTGDPGAGWSGNGVQTFDQNIQLLDGITDGDIDGWTDPSTRFTNVSVGTILTGFGTPPGVAPPTNIAFSAAAATVAESSGSYTVTVTKSIAEGNVSGEVAISGSATEGGGSDFTIDTTNFVMNGATVSADLIITINDDVDAEGPETVVLTLANVIDGTVVTPSVFTLTIAGNDSPVPAVWINEVNYDELASPDTNEFVEVAGPAGTDLSEYILVLYNGNDGLEYDSVPLSGAIDDEGCGFGAVAFATPGIQNGSPDAIALVFASGGSTSLVQFLSYEGSFAGIGGPADGYISENIGTQTASDDTLQLTGAGGAYADFTWGTDTSSKDSLNVSQTIDPCSGSGDTVLDEYDVGTFSLSASAISVTIDVTSNGVPYSLLYTTNLLTAPIPSGTADTQVATGGPLTLNDGALTDPARAYWIKTND